MSKLIDDLGNVHPALVQLGRKTGFPISDSVTLETMHSLCQTHWVQRHKSGETKLRYQIEGSPLDVEDIKLLAELCCLAEVRAINYFFAGAALLGALLARIRTRLAFLASECERGVFFSQRVYLLGSERLLNPEKEGPNQLQFPNEGLKMKQTWQPGQRALPTNEIEMMEYVVAQSDIPAEWEIIPIRTPSVLLPNGKFRPANTGETYLQWQKETGLTEGCFLLASNNPHIAYQETNARRLLPPGMKLHGIGPAANLALAREFYLDNLAKELYEARELYNRENSILKG